MLRLIKNLMMANIYKSFEIGRDGKYDLLYFLEDDYIHEQRFS